MDKEGLLKFFESLFPDFKKFWDSDENYFRETNDYTAHGVCSRFSHYFQKDYNKLSDKDLTILFRKIEEVISSKENEETTGNALYTCFLENIAGTESGNLARKYMGGKSREFFDNWN